MIFLPGCASQLPKTVVQYEVKTVYQDRYVSIGEKHPELVRPVEIPFVMPGKVGTRGLKATLQACQVRLQVCNGQLSEIAELGKQE